MEPIAHSQDKALTVHEVADLLKVNERTVYRLACKGMLPGFKVAGTWRFMANDVSEWIKNEKEKARVAGTGGHK